MAPQSLALHSDTYPFIEPGRFKDSLAGRTALVTGAGRGIGRSIALALARAGAQVACLSRTAEEVEGVVREIAQHGYPEGLAVCADVSCVSAIGEAVTAVRERFGRVDILVNNAGLDRIGALQHEPSFQAWWKVMEVNLMGPAALVHQLLPDMVRRGRGVVIHIGSRNAIHNFPFMTAYSASKTALLRFHQCLALELRGTNVHTFYVQPGDVPTTLIDGTFDAGEVAGTPRLQAILERIEHATEGGNADSPWLAANTCVMLAADERARLLSGLYIDANQDLSELVERIESGSSQVRQGRLYSLKVDML